MREPGANQPEVPFGAIFLVDGTARARRRQFDPERALRDLEREALLASGGWKILASARRRS